MKKKLSRALVVVLSVLGTVALAALAWAVWFRVTAPVPVDVAQAPAGFKRVESYKAYSLIGNVVQSIRTALNSFVRPGYVLFELRDESDTSHVQLWSTAGAAETARVAMGVLVQMEKDKRVSRVEITAHDDSGIVDVHASV